MTTLSVRVDDEQAEHLRRWAERLDVDRSHLVREALRRHLDRLAAEEEARGWVDDPDHDAAVAALASAADWGPADDWSDWHEQDG
ncbi:MAG: CopG family transcriptional regulator [Actinobacteria bacterium]|nr:CopG family transcriptional regulator [Actinomycetota bacterium]